MVACRVLSVRVTNVASRNAASPLPRSGAPSISSIGRTNRKTQPPSASLTFAPRTRLSILFATRTESGHFPAISGHLPAIYRPFPAIAGAPLGAIVMPFVESASSEPATPAAPALIGTDCECPADPRIARYFDRRSLTRRASGNRYAMGNVSQALLAALLRAGPAGRSVLELGCGPGALLTELLAAGASRATGLDLSAEAIEEARRRAAEAGVADRASLSVGDAARARLEAHDWVILDKVICCYPDADALLANSIPAARRLYAFAVPASDGWRGVLARIEEWLEGVTNALRGRPCPGYVHDVAAIERRLTDGGFRPAYRGTTWLWHIAVFVRLGAAA